MCDVIMHIFMESMIHINMRVCMNYINRIQSRKKLLNNKYDGQT